MTDDDQAGTGEEMTEMSEKPLNDLRAVADHLANGRDEYPAQIVDWAESLLNALSERTALIMAEDLWLLQATGEDVEYGLELIAIALARRGK